MIICTCLSCCVNIRFNSSRLDDTERCRFPTLLLHLILFYKLQNTVICSYTWNKISGLLVHMYIVICVRIIHVCNNISLYGIGKKHLLNHEYFSCFSFPYGSLTAKNIFKKTENMIKNHFSL